MFSSDRIEVYNSMKAKENNEAGKYFLCLMWCHVCKACTCNSNPFAFVFWDGLVSIRC